MIESCLEWLQTPSFVAAKSLCKMTNNQSLHYHYLLSSPAFYYSSTFSPLFSPAVISLLPLLMFPREKETEKGKKTHIYQKEFGIDNTYFFNPWSILVLCVLPDLTCSAFVHVSAMLSQFYRRLLGASC